MTKLPVSWEEGHVTSLSICTFRISSQCFCHFTFPTHSQHHLVCTFWNLPLALHNSQFSWEMPELLGFLASSFSMFPFALSLILAPSFFSFLSSPFSCPGESVCPAGSFCGISDMILHPCCCRTAAVMCLGHSPPGQGSHLASLFLSFLLSLLCSNVAGKTLLLSNHLACLMAAWPLLHLLPLPIMFKLFDSQFFKARSDPCGWLKGHKPVPP